MELLTFTNVVIANVSSKTLKERQKWEAEERALERERAEAEYKAEQERQSALLAQHQAELKEQKRQERRQRALLRRLFRWMRNPSSNDSPQHDDAIELDADQFQQ